MNKKSVLITGGAQRIGAFFVQEFVKKGYQVFFTCNNSLDHAKKLVQEYGSNVAYYKVDLTCPNSAESTMDWVYSHVQHLDCFINNASFMADQPLSDASWDTLQAPFGLHVFTPLLIGRLMAKQNKNAQIINVLDTKINTNQFKRAAYLLSKKTMANATKMAALEWSPKIRVNAIAPGWVLDPNGEQRSENEKQKYLNKIPLMQKVSLKQLFTTLDYLLEMPVITGQIIHLDGGTHLLSDS